MEKKKTLNFSIVILTFILAIGIYKQYDFDSHDFKKPALVVVYAVSLAAGIYLLLKDYFTRPKE